MRYCPHCDKSYSPNIDKCPTCGRILDPDKTIHCSHCGLLIEDFSFPYCPSCGAPVDVPGKYSLDPYRKRVKNHPWVYYSFAILEGFALVLLIHFPLVGTISPFNYLYGDNLLGNISIVNMWGSSSLLVTMIGVLSLLSGILGMLSIILPFVDMGARRETKNSKKTTETLIISSLGALAAFSLYGISIYIRIKHMDGGGYNAYPLLFSIVIAVCLLGQSIMKPLLFARRDDLI